MFKARRLSSHDNDIWDDLVKSSPQGEIFQLSVFLNAWVRNDSEIHLLRIGCFNDTGSLVGGQIFLHKIKGKLLYTQALLQTWTHIETPLLADWISPTSVAYVEILKALAAVVRKKFIYYKIFLHPTIKDIRPYLSSGWHAKPDYSHGWDLQDAEGLLKFLKSKKRFSKIDQTFDRLHFTDEKDFSIIDEFIPLFKASAVNKGFALRNSFGDVFRAKATEMMSHNYLRFHVCRKKSGELVAIATYVINPFKKIANGWYLAISQNFYEEKDVIPALYYYSLTQLANEVNYVDIGEGIDPSLYLYKDSLGTQSKGYFVIETPHADSMSKAISIARRLKKKLSFK